MKNKKRKNISEFAVGLYTSRWLMISASELLSDKVFGKEQEKAVDIVNNSHIYLITKVPSFSYVKESFSFIDGILEVSVKYKVNGKKKFIDIKERFPLLDDATRLELSDYPHKELLTFNNKSHQPLRHFPASVIGLNYLRMGYDKEIKGFEVLYVGQAYGDGNRTTFDRLRSHSTLQKILANVNYNCPDEEVYILSFQYEPYQILTMMDGKANTENTSEKDGKRFYSILENPLSEHQQICLAEAGLIRYFKPKYNKIYKDNFPSNNHKVLESCYNLDFSGLVVEINTEDLSVPLYSEAILSKEHHIAKINLIVNEDRYSFFHITLDKENQTIYVPDDLIE